MLLKKTGTILLLLMIFVTGIIGTGCSKDSNNTIILAHAMPLNHPVSEAMERMSELVNEKSNGELTVKIYPNQQLGSERELLELLQIGTVDVVKVSAANMESFVPEFLVFSLPYLFRDKEHVNNVLWGDVGRQILLSGTDRGFRGLTYYDAGLRSFYMRQTAVEDPSKLKGLKVRVQESVMAINFIKSLGGSPTPLAYGELYTALQSGVVDGAENNPPSYFSSRHYEVTDYYTLTEHTSVPDILLTSIKAWNQLSEQEQTWLQEAADESADYQRKVWEESVKESMQKVKDAGVEIIDPDRAPFVELVQPMYDNFKERNPELSKWVNMIKNVES